MAEASRPFPHTPLTLLLDANVFLTVLAKGWHLHQIIESVVTESYRLVCPKVVREELERLVGQERHAGNAVRLAQALAEELDEGLYLTPEERRRPVDDQLLALAQALAPRVVVVTQDRGLRQKLRWANIPVLLMGPGQGRLLGP